MLPMDDPLIVKALQDKRAEIHGRITAYEAQIAQAKHDLSPRECDASAIYGRGEAAGTLRCQSRLL